METFSYVKRGYNPEEVDAYINTLEQVIKSYKDKDNAIKNAIISAQVAADNVVKNAHLQAAEYKQRIARQLVYVQESIEIQRRKLQAFQDVYSNIVRKYLRELEEGHMLDLYSRLDEMDDLIKSLKDMDDFSPDSLS